MVNRFDDGGAPPYARSLQVWQLLIGAAANRQTVTYGKLAELMGYEYRFPLPVFAPLDVVGEYCLQYREEGMPMLPVLVVNQDTGIPGEGILRHIDVEVLNSEREGVYDYDWYLVIPPSLDDFAVVHQQAE